MARKIDGPPGFFLAIEVDDAVFFALRRAPGGVVASRFSLRAQANDIWRLLASRPDWKRTVAFRFAPACG